MKSLNRIILLLVIVIVGSSIYDEFINVPSSGTQSGYSQNQDIIISKQDARGVWPYLKENVSAASSSEELMRKNYYVVFDGSGSMEDRGCSGSVSKATAAKTALGEFSNTVPKNANLGLLVFDGNGINERVALSTQNRERFTTSANAVRPKGGTPLSSAIQRAYQRLTEQARKQLGYGEYHLVVVTDGEASTGEEPDRAVAEMLAYSPVVLHTIGFCISDRHSLNQPGKIIYKAANDVVGLKQGLASVLAEAEDFSVAQYNQNGSRD